MYARAMLPPKTSFNTLSFYSLTFSPFLRAKYAKQMYHGVISKFYINSSLLAIMQQKL
jgi:hypothetical protein